MGSGQEKVCDGMNRLVGSAWRRMGFSAEFGGGDATHGRTDLADERLASDFSGRECMALMTWDDGFSVGVKTPDDQHKGLAGRSAAHQPSRESWLEAQADSGLGSEARS